MPRAGGPDHPPDKPERYQCHGGVTRGDFPGSASTDSAQSRGQLVGGSEACDNSVAVSSLGASTELTASPGNVKYVTT